VMEVEQAPQVRFKVHRHRSDLSRLRVIPSNEKRPATVRDLNPRTMRRRDEGYRRSNPVCRPAALVELP
jgi:hypothetical protein